jgi:hypothetical protein
MNREVAHRRIAALHGHLRVEQGVQDGLSKEVQIAWSSSGEACMSLQII